LYKMWFWEEQWWWPKWTLYNLQCYIQIWM